MYLENFISGYYQKSVILMSKLPLVTFFPQVTSVIARKFFEFGDVSIETAAKDIDSWTLPSPGHSVELPLMGHLFQLTIPSLSTRSGMYLHFRFRKKRNFSVKLHNFFNLSLISSHFFSGIWMRIGQPGTKPWRSLTNFWYRWPFSMFATCDRTRPYSLGTCTDCWATCGNYFHGKIKLNYQFYEFFFFQVMASNPTYCSSTVQYLTTLIYPLNFAADYRPFYTIHDR